MECVRCRQELPDKSFPRRLGGGRVNVCRKCLRRPAGRAHSTARAERAKRQLQDKIRTGEIPVRGQCEDCGSDVNVRPRQRNEWKPLEVRWLCDSCDEP